MTRRRLLVLVTGWAVSLGVLVATGFALHGRWESVSAAGGLPGLLPVLGAVGVNLAAGAMLAQAWRRVVAAGGWHLRFTAAAWIWGASQLARYALGAAQIGGRAALARRHGVPVAAGAGTALVETLWQTSLNAAVVLATLPWWLGGARDLLWVAWTSVVPVAVLLSSLVRPDVPLRMARWALRRPWVSRLTGGADGSAAVLDRRTAAEITGWFVANTAARILAFLLLFAAVGGDWRGDAATAVGAYVLGKVVGQIAIFVPAGLGPREGATALVLAGTIGGGAALTLVAAVRLVEVLAEVLFIAFVRAIRGVGRRGDLQSPTSSR